MSSLSEIQHVIAKGRSLLPTNPVAQHRFAAAFAVVTLGAASIGMALASAPRFNEQRPQAKTTRAPQPELQILDVRQPLLQFAAVPNELTSASNAAATLTPRVEKTPDAAVRRETAVEPDVVLELPVLPEPKLKGGFPRGLHPVIKHSMVEASRYLPEGWKLEFMNALRDAPGVWNGPHGKRDHTGGALAVDVWLVNPKGERLCNFKCPQNFDSYRRFMEMVKHIQDRDFPAYRNQGRWGGYFAGGYANDEMHYDLEPSNWTMAGNWKQGLLPGYAHFAMKGETLRGMGDMASFTLPGPARTVAIAQADIPVIVPQRSTAVPERTAAARPAAKPVYQRVAQRVVRPQRVWRQPTRRYYRDGDDD